MQSKKNNFFNACVLWNVSCPSGMQNKKVRYSLGPPRSVLLPHFSIMAHFLPWLSSFRTQMKTYCILICQQTELCQKRKRGRHLEREREREGGQSTCSCLLHLAYPYRSPKIPWLMKCSSKFKPRSSLISCRHCYASLSFILSLSFSFFSPAPSSPSLSASYFSRLAA